jgi:hypothetical protein
MPQMPSFENAQIKARNAANRDMLNNKSQFFMHDRCETETMISAYEYASLNSAKHASSERRLPLLTALLPPPTPDRRKNGPWEGAPEGWEERMDGRGRLYYVSMADKTLSWEHPTKGRLERLEEKMASMSSASSTLATPQRSTSSLGSEMEGGVGGKEGRVRKSSILRMESSSSSNRRDATQEGFLQQRPRDKRASVRFKPLGAPSSPPPQGGGATGADGEGRVPPRGAGACADGGDGGGGSSSVVDAKRQLSDGGRATPHPNGARANHPPGLKVDPLHEAGMSKKMGGWRQQQQGRGDAVGWDEASLMTTTSGSSLGWKGRDRSDGGPGRNGGIRVHGHLACAMRLNHPDVSIRMNGFPKGVAVATPNGLLDCNGEMLPSRSTESDVWSAPPTISSQSSLGSVFNPGKEEILIQIREWLLTPQVQGYRSTQKDPLKLPAGLSGKVSFLDGLAEAKQAFDSGQISKDAFRHIKEVLFGPSVRNVDINERDSPSKRRVRLDNSVDSFEHEPSWGGAAGAEAGSDALTTTYRSELKSPWTESGLETDLLPVAGASSMTGEVAFPGTVKGPSGLGGSVKATRPPASWESRGVTALMYDAAYAEEAENVRPNSVYGAEMGDRFAPENWLNESNKLRAMRGPNAELPEQYEKATGRRHN